MINHKSSFDKAKTIDKKTLEKLNKITNKAMFGEKEMSSQEYSSEMNAQFADENNRQESHLGSPSFS